MVILYYFSIWKDVAYATRSLVGWNLSKWAISLVDINVTVPRLFNGRGRNGPRGIGSYEYITKVACYQIPTCVFSIWLKLIVNANSAIKRRTIMDKTFQYTQFPGIIQCCMIINKNRCLYTLVEYRSTNIQCNILSNLLLMYISHTALC